MAEGSGDDGGAALGADEAAPAEDAPKGASEGPKPAEASSSPRRSTIARRALRVVLGLAVGLGIAEAVFALRDHGAFPHLNLYEADPDLAVHLRPGSSQKLSLGSNPVTTVHVNAQGFRGPDLPPPAGGEIVVVGDSQVFGLGVEDDETASAQLARITGTPVINAGVPTYGPLEYNAVAKRLLETYQPSALVYVVNFSNDLFEASRPNTTRHAVWDGWAVRKETEPEHVTAFPGRELLFRDSHAVFALRSFLYRHGEQLDDRGFASEGSFADLVGEVEKGREEADRKSKALADDREKQLVSLTASEVEAELELQNTALDTLNLRGYELGIAYEKSRNNPGDIVVTSVHYAEEAREARHTATQIFNGAKVRKEVEERIRAFVEQKVAGEEEAAKKLALSLEERDVLKKRIADLRATPLQIVQSWSPMTPVLREVKALCDARGVKLLVVALPMDVMVSSTEWTKYGESAPAIDMKSTSLLVDDLLASARALGALTLDATAYLADAEPGAFLDGDIHMTPKGQRALAQAISHTLP